MNIRGLIKKVGEVGVKNRERIHSSNRSESIGRQGLVLRVCWGLETCLLVVL